MMETHETPTLSREFVCGLIVGEGCFSVVRHHKNNQYVPTFEIRMHVRDKELIEKVRDAMGLVDTRVYEYIHSERHYCGFIVRRTSTLLSIVIPYFDGYLDGYKKMQFNEWKNFIEVMRGMRIDKKLAAAQMRKERDDAILRHYGI